MISDFENNIHSFRDVMIDYQPYCANLRSQTGVSECTKPAICEIITISVFDYLAENQFS
jgi:hypothetical protein